VGQHRGPPQALWTQTPSPTAANDRAHHFVQCGRRVGVVGEGVHDRRVAGRRQAQAPHQARGHHQQACAGGFFQIVVGEPAHGLRQLHQAGRHGCRAAAFGLHDVAFGLGLRIVERQRHKALPRAGLEALEQVLVARVVADDEHEARRRLQQFTRALHRQHTPVVGQRVQHHGGVLARFHHFVQVADGALAHGAGQRAVGPHRVAAADEVAAHQVGRAQVVVAAHRDQRPAQARCHVFHQPRLAAAGGALDEQRQPRRMGLRKERAFVALRRVERRGGQLAGAGHFHGGWPHAARRRPSGAASCSSVPGPTKKLAR
jgi:hypothetical protein